MAGELADLAGIHVQYLQRGKVAVAQMRMLLPDERQGLAVRFPRDRRRRRARWPALGKAPGARGQPLGILILGAHQPDVGGSWRTCGQVVVVSHLERIIVFLDLFLVGRVVAGDVRDVLAVRPPSELFDPVGSVGGFPGVSAGHGHDEYLRAIFSFGDIVLARRIGHDRHEGQPVAARGPAGGSHPPAAGRQHPLRAAGHIYQHQFAVGAVRVEIRPRYHADDRFAVR